MQSLNSALIPFHKNIDACKARKKFEKMCLKTESLAIFFVFCFDGDLHLKFRKFQQVKMEYLFRMLLVSQLFVPVPTCQSK